MDLFLGLMICLLISPIGLLFAVKQLFYKPELGKIWAPMLVLSLGILAYAYMPSTENDLTRYFDMAYAYSNMDYLDAVEYGTGMDEDKSNQIPLFVLEAWILGNLHAVHVIPMITIMTIYGVAFYIDIDVAKIYHLEKKIPYIVLVQLCFLAFLTLAANVRNIWGFSMIILAAYLDLVKHKRNIGVIALYLAPLFIHTATSVLLGLRILVYLGRKWLIAFGLIVAFFPQIAAFLFNIRSVFEKFGTIGSWISVAIWQLYIYIVDTGSSTGTSDWATQVANSLYQRIQKFGMISFTVLAVILILFYVDKHCDQRLSRFLKFELLICIATLAFAWVTTPAYFRFASAYCIGFAAVLLPCFLPDMKNYLFIQVFKCLLVPYSLLFLVGQFWGNQYTTDYLDWILTFLVTNIFTIIGKLIYGVLYL